ANQFIHEYEKLAASLSRRYRRRLKVTIQTGEQRKDTRFEGDIIFCTVDQFLISYLTMPYSLPNRLANLNAGAFVGAYIVFDEFHLLDPNSTLPTVLQIINQLQEVSQILLMTATFSKKMIKQLAEMTKAEWLLVSPDEAKQIATLQGTHPPKQRCWCTASAPLSADAVVREHQTRSLVLCNTVQRAQDIYRNIKTLCDEDTRKIHVLVLHSRFLQNDRKDIEDFLRVQFGRDAEDHPEYTESIIAVATQAIEVGVDITCETLHTELAPASSLIQRAGRCARYAGEEGKVIVYSVETYMPYGAEIPDNPNEEALWVKEMKAAFAWLTEHSGEVFAFEQEQAFVNAVATARDQSVLDGIQGGRVTRKHRVEQVLQGERLHDDQKLLIRNADSRRVLIHEHPDELLKNPFSATGFNLSPTVLHGMFKRWMERELWDEPEWRVQWLNEDQDKSITKDAAEANRTSYIWCPMNHRSLLDGARAIVVHPMLAGYLKDEGFMADLGETDFRSELPNDAESKTWEGSSLKKETYEEHIRLVIEALKQVAKYEIEYPASVLERAAGWKTGSVMQTAWLTCLCHDIGKLSKGWQAWSHAYQAKIGDPAQRGEALAHTESEWGNKLHEDAERAVRKQHPRPNHAGESAYAAAGILAASLGEAQLELAQAAMTAIMRHHTPFARECGRYTLVPDAFDHIENTLQYLPIELQTSVQIDQLIKEAASIPTEFGSYMVLPTQKYAWAAYLLLVRSLRRADQEGTKRGSL
ncbi:MAG: CRISPR-associated helicase Cas3', partial [Chloroflexota bacterium]